MFYQLSVLLCSLAVIAAVGVKGAQPVQGVRGLKGKAGKEGKSKGDESEGKAGKGKEGKGKEGKGDNSDGFDDYKVRTDFGITAEESNCGDIQRIFTAMEYATKSPVIYTGNASHPIDLTEVTARVSEWADEGWVQSCSQGKCFYDESTPSPNFDEIVHHFITDSIILTEWTVRKVEVSYGKYYARGSLILATTNKCGDRFIGNTEFTFYCNGAPNRATEYHIIRDETTFTAWKTATEACAGGGDPVN